MSIAVLGTPRTASSLLCKISADKFGAFNLAEVWSHNVTITEDTRLRRTWRPTEGVDDDSQSLHKFDLLQQHVDQSYVLKFFPVQIGNSEIRHKILHWLDQHYQIICLSRQDTLAQMLSFGIAKHADRWESGIQFDYQMAEITFDERWYEAFSEDLKLYYQCLGTIQQQRFEMDYEDVIRLPRANKYPRNKYRHDKLDLFANSSEILTWHHELQNNMADWTQRSRKDFDISSCAGPMD